MDAVRVIATDLDRTLLGPAGTFTERAAAALAAARAAGIAVVAVTARPHRAFEVWTWAADAFDDVICAGGTTVYDPRTRRVTVNHTLAPARAASTAERLRAAIPRVTFAVETGYDIVAEPGYTKRDSVLDRRRRCDSLEDSLAAAASPLKLLAHVEGGRAEDLVQAASTLDLDGLLLHQAGSQDQIEFGPAGVDKATGLAAWCLSRGVEAGHVVAFGDSPADVSMLAWAGRSYAVANAHPAAAAAATDQCAANTDDGVATVIEALTGEPATLRH
ncbi:HAD-IIB family hydrolase [Glycomyces albidus]|uniref:HAD-IIB family hydrolase n=1 Tax=Glycomyces albidus TaxID=2656774 RepID=A0A6L5G849_9ACTN|nr:HAD-IIB family hydrolase [Glycomyces albidus]MQM25796.1 HAD-IIB family hydrolase [Glycomyces albidus]